MTDKRVQLNGSLLTAGQPQNKTFAFMNFIKGCNGIAPAITRFLSIVDNNGIPTTAPTTDVNWSGLPVHSVQCL